MLFELLVGGTIFTSPPDGTWWQSRYPHELTNRSPALSIGMVHGPWVGRVNYLVRGTSYCLCDPDDASYGSGKTVGELSEFTGKGDLLSLTLSYRWTHGNWYWQAGVSAVNARWKVNVKDWYPLGQPTQKSNISVKHDRWTVSPEISVGYKILKDIGVELRVVPRIAQGGPYTPMFRNPATSLMIKYEF